MPNVQQKCCKTRHAVHKPILTLRLQPHEQCQRLNTLNKNNGLHLLRGYFRIDITKVSYIQLG